MHRDPRMPSLPTVRSNAAADAATTPALLDPLQPLAEQIAWTERRAIAAAMKRSAGNRVAAARLLGMPRSVLYDRLARYPELMSS